MADKRPHRAQAPSIAETLQPIEQFVGDVLKHLQETRDLLAQMMPPLPEKALHSKGKPELASLVTGATKLAESAEATQQAVRTALGVYKCTMGATSASSSSRTRSGSANDLQQEKRWVGGFVRQRQCPSGRYWRGAEQSGSFEGMCLMAVETNPQDALRPVLPIAPRNAAL
jgi:hypothetical protein